MPIFTYLGRTFVKFGATGMRWLTHVVDDAMSTLMAESKAAIKATPKSAPKSLAEATATATRDMPVALRAAYTDAKQAGKAAAKTAASPPGAKPTTSAKRPGDTGGREQQKEQEKNKMPRERLRQAGEDLVAFVKNYVRSGAAHLAPKSPFTKIAQANRSNIPLVDKGEFIDSLKATIIGNMISVGFPADEHSNGMTHRDIYNIVSLGAHVPVTAKTKAYFGVNYGLHPSAPYYKIPARPFLRKAVMIWVTKNRDFVQHVILPPY